jgi:hypothetical protein
VFLVLRYAATEGRGFGWGLPIPIPVFVATVLGGGYARDHFQVPTWPQRGPSLLDDTSTSEAIGPPGDAGLAFDAEGEEADAEEAADAEVEAV